MQFDQDNSNKVSVLIVDDTRSIRAMIKAMLETSPCIEVVGEAGDPYEAREKIKELNPDVITLDVVMPRMNGLAFLERLMRLRPMPVVMVSTRTTEKSYDAIKALSLGAVDCVDLGQLRQSQNAKALADVVLLAARSNVRRADAPTNRTSKGSTSFDWNGKVVVIGSSTGGVDALLQVLSAIPENGPPIVIAQHMPEAFLTSFTERLERNCPPTVQPAKDGAVLKRGTVHVAPGGTTQTLISERDPYRLTHLPHDGTEAYVPSVNLLFGSAVAHARKMIGVMLTGMGNDGSQPMLKMREAGAHTIVQDGASAVIDGMPGSARALGAAIEVASLSNIGARILSSAGTSRTEQAV